jgi:hypothetical protein
VVIIVVVVIIGRGHMGQAREKPDEEENTPIKHRELQGGDACATLRGWS